MAASQQFSLRWNNYSQHIVTAFDDLRAGDELTDVTLSCDGQRIKAHKMLLSACSVYFRDTFRENPCKHPVIILKGVSFVDLKAVVAFMYNGQVNVTQERLPFFLQTAELLQIKGLTDMNDKEGSNNVNNRPQSSSSNTSAANINPSSLVNTSLDSSSMCETPENANRPLTPKRKRFNAPNLNTIDSNATTSSMGLIGFNQQNAGPVISGVTSSGVHGMNVGMGNGISMGGPGPSITSVSGSLGSSSSSSHFNPHPVTIPPESNSSDTFPGGAMVKYEDEELPDDDDYDKNDVSEDNDNSVQDMLGSMDTSALGTYRTSGGVAGPSSMVKDQTGTDSSSHAIHRTRANERDKLQSQMPGIEIEELDEEALLNKSVLRHNIGVYQSMEINDVDYDEEEDEDEEYNELSDTGNAIQVEQDDDVVEVEEVDDEVHVETSNASKSYRRFVRPLPRLIKSSSANFFANKLKSKASSHLTRIQNRQSISTSVVLSNTPSFSLTSELLESQNSTGNSSKQLASDSTGAYVCDLCGKRYAHHRSLNDHKKFHSGATTCPICKKAFSKVANMRAHFAAQHLE